jgi:hypothetical protein
VRAQRATGARGTGRSWAAREAARAADDQGGTEHVDAPVGGRARAPRRPVGDLGMTTAEYAVGTVAACGFAGVLFKLLTSDSVVRMLKDIVERALTIAF